jgi:hypothetical protein
LPVFVACSGGESVSQSVKWLGMEQAGN